MRHREVRVQFDRTLEVRHRFETGNHSPVIQCERVRMQRLERTRRRLCQRSVESLDERERFSEPFTKSRGDGAELSQHLLLGRNLHLLACEDLAAFPR